MEQMERSYVNLLAISDYQPTPPSFLKKVGEEFRRYRKIEFEVNLFREEQLVAYHPSVVERVICEMPYLSCRRGGLVYDENKDFLEEVRKKNGMTLGVFWKQIAAAIFDIVSGRLGYGEHKFRWFPKVNRKKSSKRRTVYSVLCFHTNLPPPEFFSLAVIATGYMNALLEGEDFDLSEQLDDFVKHRRTPHPNSPENIRLTS